MNVVTLGPAGTYSHRAARAVAAEVSFRESVTAIVDAVEDGEFERGVVPIENSIEGSVTESLDALADHDVAVTKEVVTPIRHALLAQWRTWLEKHHPDVGLEAVASTARGVERAREDARIAGIGHPDNAGDDLEILAEGIQDRTSNATRFLVVAPEHARSDAGGKTTLIVYPNDNYPGLLLELLEAFADRNLNLSRIESRPSGERLGDYMFHFDVDAGLYEDHLAAAIEDIEAIAEKGWVRVLGSYDTEHVLE